MESVLKEAIVDALDVTWQDMAEELCHTPLSHWDESVFRFFFVRAFLRRNPEARCHVEWNKIDLVIQCFDENALVEFKFYRAEPMYNLTGKHFRFKGGAGKKNFGEFCDCVTKLASIEKARWQMQQRERIDAKLLILAYEHRPDLLGEKAFRHWYTDVHLPNNLPCKDSLSTVKIFEPIVCRKSNREINCQLFAVA
jgi:hypothetical protein